MSENPVIEQKTLTQLFLQSVDMALRYTVCGESVGTEAKGQLCRILHSNGDSPTLLTICQGQDLAQLPPPYLNQGCLTSIMSCLFSMWAFLVRLVCFLCLSSGLLVMAQLGGGLLHRYVSEGDVPWVPEGKAFLICPSWLAHG